MVKRVGAVLLLVLVSNQGAFLDFAAGGPVNSTRQKGKGPGGSTPTPSTITGSNRAGVGSSTNTSTTTSSSGPNTATTTEASSTTTGSSGPDDPKTTITTTTSTTTEGTTTTSSTTITSGGVGTTTTRSGTTRRSSARSNSASCSSTSPPPKYRDGDELGLPFIEGIRADLAKFDFHTFRVYYVPDFGQAYLLIPRVQPMTRLSVGQNDLWKKEGNTLSHLMIIDAEGADVLVSICSARAGKKDIINLSLSPSTIAPSTIAPSTITASNRAGANRAATGSPFTSSSTTSTTSSTGSTNSGSSVGSTTDGSGRGSSTIGTSPITGRNSARCDSATICGLSYLGLPSFLLALNSKSLSENVERKLTLNVNDSFESLYFNHHRTIEAIFSHDVWETHEGERICVIRDELHDVVNLVHRPRGAIEDLPRDVDGFVRVELFRLSWTSKMIILTTGDWRNFYYQATRGNSWERNGYEQFKSYMKRKYRYIIPNRYGTTRSTTTTASTIAPSTITSSNRAGANRAADGSRATTTKGSSGPDGPKTTTITTTSTTNTTSTSGTTDSSPITGRNSAKSNSATIGSGHEVLALKRGHLIDLSLKSEFLSYQHSNFSDYKLLRMTPKIPVSTRQIKFGSFEFDLRPATVLSIDLHGFESSHFLELTLRDGGGNVYTRVFGSDANAIDPLVHMYLDDYYFRMAEELGGRRSIFQMDTTNIMQRDVLRINFLTITGVNELPPGLQAKLAKLAQSP